VQAGAKSFTNDLLGVGTETSSNALTTYVRDNRGRLVSERTPNGTFYYLIDGHPGSVVAITNQAGSVAAAYQYDPYGNAVATTGTAPNPWRFASAYLDDTGLYKMGARYYDPAAARWTQRDPLNQMADPAEANRYTYGADDPVNKTDATGCGTQQVIECIAAACGVDITLHCGRYLTFPIAGTYLFAACSAIYCGHDAFLCYYAYRHRKHFP
jgi:RHS repeat-associated protein